MKVVRTSTYEKGLKRLRKLGASSEDLARMEHAIVGNPKGGDVIQRAGGRRAQALRPANQGIDG
jgi:hypothetical protein